MVTTTTHPAVPGIRGRTCAASCASSSSIRTRRPASRLRYSAPRSSVLTGRASGSTPSWRRNVASRAAGSAGEELAVRKLVMDAMRGVHGQGCLADPAHPCHYRYWDRALPTSCGRRRQHLAQQLHLLVTPGEVGGVGWQLRWRSPSGRSDRSWDSLGRRGRRRHRRRAFRRPGSDRDPCPCVSPLGDVTAARCRERQRGLQGRQRLPVRHPGER
jgi:hypothetical protein